MILAAAIAPTAVKHGLQYYAFTFLIVALLVLLVLKLIYWVLNVWEKWRIIAHYRREERKQKNGGAK